MNKRIKEFAKQSGFVLWEDETWNEGNVIDWNSQYDKELETFARIIVKESLIDFYNNNFYSALDSDINTQIEKYCNRIFGKGI